MWARSDRQSRRVTSDTARRSSATRTSTSPAHSPRFRRRCSVPRCSSDRRRPSWTWSTAAVSRRRLPRSSIPTRRVRLPWSYSHVIASDRSRSRSAPFLHNDQKFDCFTPFDFLCSPLQVQGKFNMRSVGRRTILTTAISTVNKSSAVAEMGDRLATIDEGRKVGAAVPLSLGGAGYPSNTMWPGPSPTSVPSGIVIRPTVWPQYTNVTDRTTLP